MCKLSVTGKLMNYREAIFCHKWEQGEGAGERREEERERKEGRGEVSRGEERDKNRKNMNWTTEKLRPERQWPFCQLSSVWIQFFMKHPWKTPSFPLKLAQVDLCPLWSKSWWMLIQTPTRPRNLDSSVSLQSPAKTALLSILCSGVLQPSPLYLESLSNHWVVLPEPRLFSFLFTLHSTIRSIF